MPGGTHITEEMCREIRQLKARGRWVWLIAREMDISRAAVHYHVAGKRAHPPPPDGLLDSDTGPQEDRDR